MVAIQEQRRAFARLLLDAGADVNTLNAFGEGVPNYAIYIRDPILIAAALDRGVDTGQLDKLFTTVEYDPPGYLDVPPHYAAICK